MPTLEDLGTRQIITGTPVGSDVAPFFDVSEFGNSPIKKATLASLTVAGIGGDPAGARSAIADEDGNFPVDGLVIEDSSAVALADGVIGWNATLGAFVEHDDATIGGNIIAPTHPWSTKGCKIILGATLATQQLTELFEFPLTSTQAVLGKRYRLSGTYSITFNGTRPANAYFGVLTDASLVSEEPSFIYGVSHETEKTVQSSIFWEFELLDAGGGEFYLSNYVQASSEVRLIGTTTSMVLRDEAANPSIGEEKGPVGAAQSLKLHFNTPATPSAGPAFVVWDLKLEATN